MIDRFDQFVTGITTCYKYIQRIKSAEMTEFGLKGAHVMCLYYLHRNPEGLTAAQLCTLCAEDKAAISRTVHELREKGYIGAEDKSYRTRLTLTESGRAVAEQFDTLIASWVTAGGDGLSAEERDAFYRALSLISQNLRQNFEHKN